jgi:hypothetical protein
MKLIFLLLPFAFFSCINNKHDSLSKSDSLKTLNSKAINQTESKILKFEEYWKEFGTAIQTLDTEKIKLLVESPLVILGREDQDPQLKINQDEVVKYVISAANSGGFYDLERDSSISNKTLLRRDLKSIHEYDQESDTQQIHDFVFKKTTKGWKLVTLYMDTKVLKK